MKTPSPRQPPEALRKRGITGAVEVAPHADFRIKNAGQRLALLFNSELQQRLSRCVIKKETVA
jgi:hypothetical protein